MADGKRCAVFVYGTLKDGSGEPDAISGDLLDLGWFPGAVNVGRSSRTVHGEIRSVDSQTLARWDRREGHPVLYCRVRVKTRGELQAWAYEYRGADRATAPRIESGVWEPTVR